MAVNTIFAPPDEFVGDRKGERLAHAYAVCAILSSVFSIFTFLICTVFISLLNLVGEGNVHKFCHYFRNFLFIPGLAFMLAIVSYLLCLSMTAYR